MSLEEILRKDAEEQKSKSNFLNLKDIGGTLALKLKKFEKKADNRGKACMYLTLETESGQLVVQKFTPTAYSELLKTIEQSGGTSSLGQHYHVYEKRKIGRAIFDRLFPTTEIVQPKKQKGK